MIKSDHRPLYLQVIDRLKNEIDNGLYEAGEQLPSEFELSKQLGVSRATLREALRMLEDENVIVRRHGVGTFVNTKPLFSSGIEELFSITDMIKRGNETPGTIFLSSDVYPAEDDDKERLSMKDLEEMLVVERVRTADSKPVVYCLDRIPKKYIKNYDMQSGKSFFEQLEESGINISYAVTHIEPLGYHDKISDILNCDLDTSLLLLKQLHFDVNERPIFYSINYFRSDKFKFHVLRKRV
ncbi:MULTISPECIES: GntR family transcriptional regulator [Bacillaceae]|uniref:GntR family transcriptional regulator n=1 Tax=Evansella alkalicola TaxID=745819 RepID=A0ABS6JVS5_9BACI|nr:GntR family transcriptional regulator [Litchfieldia alkalitelluris]MBU9722683.1 GntR family transcriptional regulator [Bacillus alkalicola]